MLPRIVLASASPYRSKLLAALRLDFDCVPSGVDEIRGAHESPEAYVQRLSIDKAREVSTRVGPDVVVLGADTLGCLAQEVFEKPKDLADFTEMMLKLSNTTHQVLTSVCCTYRGVVRTALVTTDVTFVPLNEQMIQGYWATGEPADKSGGYSIQGLGSLLIKEIKGSYSGVVGLPLRETWDLLNACVFDPPRVFPAVIS